MKAFNYSPLAAFILKLVGVLLILSFLLDVVVLLATARFQDSQWLLTFTTQLVERGFIAMVGLALLFTGFWIQATGDASDGATHPGRGLRLAALILSSILGLLFLILIPSNISSTQSVADNQVRQISQEAENAQKQIDAQVQQQLGMQMAMVDQALKSGQLSGEQETQARQQLEQLNKLKSDPKALEAKVGPQRKQELDRINKRKQELTEQTRQNALRSGMRTGLNSLLLAIGFALIGWVGLRWNRSANNPFL